MRRNGAWEGVSCLQRFRVTLLGTFRVLHDTSIKQPVVSSLVVYQISYILLQKTVCNGWTSFHLCGQWYHQLPRILYADCRGVSMCFATSMPQPCGPTVSARPDSEASKEAQNFLHLWSGERQPERCRTQENRRPVAAMQRLPGVDALRMRNLCHVCRVPALPGCGHGTWALQNDAHCLPRRYFASVVGRS